MDKKLLHQLQDFCSQLCQKKPSIVITNKGMTKAQDTIFALKISPKIIHLLEKSKFSTHEIKVNTITGKTDSKNYPTNPKELYNLLSQKIDKIINKVTSRKAQIK